MSFSISWWVKSRTWIEYWLEIDIRSSQNVEIEYSSQVKRLISSTWVESEDWYWNSTWWLIYFQSSTSSTLQLFKSISWQVFLFCFITIQISKHSWFIQFSTIIWFWIKIISSIEFSLAFDSCFESESNLSKIWVRSWSAFIDCNSNLSFDNSIWCWYSFRSSFASTDLTSDILISASTFRFCFSDWYMILKLYSDNFSAHLACYQVSSLMIMKYFKFRWSMKILIEIFVHFNLKRQCFKQRIMISSSLS